MSFIIDGRVGLRPEITGFVVTEDKSLEARLKRAYRAARSQAVNVARAQSDAATNDSAGLAPSATKHIATDPVRRRDPAAVLAAIQTRLRPALAWMWQLVCGLRAYLPGRDRLRDLASLALIGAPMVLRFVWWLPRLAKIVLFAVTLVGLVLIWPAPAVDAGPADASASSAAEASPPVTTEPVPVRWRSIAAPIASYNLEAPELSRAGASLRARAASDGARQEIHLWTGGKDKNHNDTLSGMLAIEHYVAAPPDEALYVDLVRRAAMLGAAVERTGEMVGLESKFGEIDTIEARIVAAGDTQAQSCIAFRRVETTPAMQIHGWFCGSASVPVDRATLGCIVDRIDLMRAGSDVALRRHFASIERRRKPCGAPRQAVAKPGWIDADGAMPALKTALPAIASRK